MADVVEGSRILAQRFSEAETRVAAFEPSPPATADADTPVMRWLRQQRITEARRPG
jgi:hypothetical protein